MREVEMSEDDENDADLPVVVSTRSQTPSTTTTQSFSSSPPDQVLENVIENVLCFLTSRHDRNSVSLVCKSWYRAESLTRFDLFIGNCYSISPQRAIQRFGRLRSLTLKGKPRFADFSLVPPNWGAHFTPWLVAMSDGCPWLEKIYLKRMSITDEDLNVIAEGFPGLKELVLVCCEGFSTRGLGELVSKCRQLRVLELIEDEVMDADFDWIFCFPDSVTVLESLAFECVDYPINFDALNLLVARSPLLKKLRLNRHVTVGQLRVIMLRVPQLTHLGTGSFNSSDVVSEQDQELDLTSCFASCGNLTCLSGFRDIAPDYLPWIHPVCANLTSLNFSYANINAEQLGSVVCHCHKLQVFWCLDSVCDEGLQALAATCSDLRELRVFPMDAREDSECPVSEVGLLAISQGCPKLRSILYFCQKMTNAVVIAMSKNCPDLVVFRLCIMGRHLPDHLTGEPMDEGFGAIVMNCKKLTRLATSGLLTDRAFSLIGKYGNLVRTLSLAFAGDGDLGLSYVLKGCSNLQKLEIRDSPFGDTALFSGLHHYYNMRFVWMSSCNLTLRGCKLVARRMPQLAVEVIRDVDENDEDGSVEKIYSDVEDENEVVEKFYMYRSLDGHRNDAPNFVSIL
ncbi:hypothetical protein GIB67_019600 [Kingdonia uniflora]|uniref:Uncharacterized protein n=1 Tax=Kingdonia uniflora TaxID=39325 RepID=A0A7J7N0W5_9MAGN|nr:hypothetical protein GIB67_019600 [Kingdonia uniflora]